MTTTIQWFPGHMAKARREATEKLNLVDIVLELVDARIPESSRNPMIDEIVKHKPRIMVLNKADIADKAMTTQWIRHYENQGFKAIAIDAQHSVGLKQLEKICQDMMADYFDKQKAKGVKPRAIRLMILGIPNVGKSTLINRFVGKNQAITGNKPGVTKAQRWLKIGRNFELLDTPGILWPKFEDPDVGKKLAITGAIKDQLLHMDDLALYLIDCLRQQAPSRLASRSQIPEEDLSHTSNVDLLMTLTQKMGLKEDYETASLRLVNEFRQQKWGNLTLDLPYQGIKEND